MDLRLNRSTPQLNSSNGSLPAINVSRCSGYACLDVAGTHGARCIARVVRCVVRLDIKLGDVMAAWHIWRGHGSVVAVVWSYGRRGFIGVDGCGGMPFLHWTWPRSLDDVVILSSVWSCADALRKIQATQTRQAGRQTGQDRQTHRRTGGFVKVNCGHVSVLKCTV